MSSQSSGTTVRLILDPNCQENSAEQTRKKPRRTEYVQLQKRNEADGDFEHV